GGGASLRWSADRVSRRGERSREHGAPFLDAASFLTALGPARHEERRLPDGACGDRGAALHARQHHAARRHVLDQRLPHVLADRARHGAPLDRGPAQEPRWKSQLSIHGTGLVMCLTILGITLYEKFAEGGWMTSLVTSATIFVCFLIRRHYESVQRDLKRLDDV